MLLFPIPASPFFFFIGYKVQGREVVCTKDVFGITSFPSPPHFLKKLVGYVFVVCVCCWGFVLCSVCLFCFLFIFVLNKQCHGFSMLCYV
jgi:hypothetical protein